MKLVTPWVSVRHPHGLFSNPHVSRLLHFITSILILPQKIGMMHDFESGDRKSRVDSNGNNCKGIAAFMVSKIENTTYFQKFQLLTS